ncbi:hypothetical protein GI374_01110 [Paracoccus sp. S-4012]|uniref:hypothetical protein n=1 Tax=Paracoccus sp. S-4012 TaxID=2665648 RepID=UPI0012AFFA0B|nr:hypothetical protein [Paracoccus sp. S-4012]MRX49057.1 hypothetical protein [Paracoccus sp. S-4012]
MQNTHLIAAGALAIALAALASTLAGSEPEQVARPLVPRPIAVGAIAPAAETHLIERPGLYGLGPQPVHGRYAIVSDSLVRLDPATMMVRSVIRRQVHPVD